jgi:putative ABC transport system permease protein
MSTLWQKVFADLWLAKSRSLLAVLSIAVGVFCIGTLFGMLDLQLAKMDAAHQLSQPSHINLILRSDAGLAVLAKIKAMPGVAGVDTMTQLSVQFRRPGEVEWRPATLMVRADYQQQRYDKTMLQTGDWPSANDLALENLSAQATGLQIGEQLEFETPTGSQVLMIKGVVRHPFVKPPKFGGQVHFFTDAAGGERFGVAANTFRQLLVQISAPYSVEQARAVAGNIRALLAEQGIPVNVSLLQDPQRHWGRPILAGVNGVLQIMALAGLALASVLILNTVSAHLTLQIQQIGVMKALGASAFAIAKIYVMEVLLLALVAVLLAIPPALAAGYYSSCGLLALFNIDCGGFVFSPRALLLMLCGGLLAPLLAALGPILRAAGLPVRVALANYGLGGEGSDSRSVVWLERHITRYLPTMYAVALGNLLRRKARFLFTQSVLLIAGIMFLLLMSLIASLNLTLDQEMARSRFAVRLGFTVDQNARKVVDIAGSVPGTDKVEVWQRLPIELSQQGATLRQKGALGVQMLALPADSQLYQPLIEAGRWLQAADAGHKVVLLSADTARLNGVQVGDYLDVGIGPKSQAWQVVGLYRWLLAGNFAVEPVYAPLETLRELTQQTDMASYALLAADISNPDQEAAYLQLLRQRFQAQAIKLDVYTTQAKLEQRQFTRNQFNPVLGTLFGLAAMLAVVGGIGLSGALAIEVLQRTREIGVLRAIGAHSKTVFRLFMLEGLLHGLIAWALSVPLAYLLAKPVAQELGQTMLGIALDFAFDWWAVAYWLGIVLVLALAAAYWPARQAMGLTVRECLA